MTEKFRASTQYNDLKGTSAADEQDIKTITKWLEENNHINNNDTLIGLSMYAHGKSPVGVSFLVVNLNNGQTIPDLINSSNGEVPVKKIDIDMSALEFIELFKRFNITLSFNNLFEEVEFCVQ